MYLGKIMELAGRKELFSAPLHPYTQSLISAVPIPDPELERRRQRVILPGETPNPSNPPSGCVFHTRCPLAQEICRREIPVYREVRPDHFAACHLIEE
jgi:oligopeptide/dipeptide ABC transporter ATP-binding protein